MQIIKKTPPEYSESKERVLSRIWRWTGFSDKTLWDWLHLSGAVAIPFLLGMFTLQQDDRAAQRKISEEKIASQQDRREEEIARDEQQHKMMSEYLDQMTKLTLGNEWRENASNREKMQFASARTLNAFRQLDAMAIYTQATDDPEGIKVQNDESLKSGERKGLLLKFLYDAKLIGGDCKRDNTILKVDCREPSSENSLNLTGARLDGARFEFKKLKLEGINLKGVSLNGAQLQEISLMEANLEEAKLKEANLSGALLEGAVMNSAILERAILIGAIMVEVDLQGANLTGANLQGTALKSTNLTGANLQGADLKDATYNSNTIFPKGFDPVAAEMRKVTE